VQVLEIANMKKKSPATAPAYQAALENKVCKTLCKPSLVFFAGKFLSQGAVTGAEHGYCDVQRDEIDNQQLKSSQKVPENRLKMSNKKVKAYQMPAYKNDTSLSIGGAIANITFASVQYAPPNLSKS
jgi:hypothetical protein